MSRAKNTGLLHQLPEMQGLIDALKGFGRAARQGIGSPLIETTGFGTNPGNLRMFFFVPERLQPSPGLVVVLHGCVQNAAGYDLGAGWSTLAKHYGFALLMPEQQPSNNANRCFNWFNPQDSKRGGGEASSIRQMIARMVSDYKVGKHRIFVTGLSAGGAMSSVMLASYPEMFSAGAIIAGLPYGVATDAKGALIGMLQSPARPASELGDLVRKASRHRGPWPKVSVWHGSADRMVNPANADEIVKQWLDVHQLPSAPMSEGTVDGYPHQIWWNADGETVVESYTITSMAHGTPLGTAENDERYGMQGAFLIEAGISSSYHIAKFFGLTERIRELQGVTKPAAKPTAKRARAESASTRLIPLAPPISTSALDRSKVMGNAAKESPQRKRRYIDVGAMITRALTAMGFKK